LAESQAEEEAGRKVKKELKVVKVKRRDAAPEAQRKKQTEITDHLPDALGRSRVPMSVATWCGERAPLSAMASLLQG
jgi:hypothetical protein